MSRFAPKPNTSPKTPRKRLFTDEFKLRDEVTVTRHEHGWCDGRESGVIVDIGPMNCAVRMNDGSGVFQIGHPRDIRKKIL